jgi:hypothetical protein
MRAKVIRDFELPFLGEIRSRHVCSVIEVQLIANESCDLNQIITLNRKFDPIGFRVDQFCLLAQLSNCVNDPLFRFGKL